MKYDSLYLSITNVIEYIEENLKNPITLDLISDHVNISKFHLNRIFSSLSKTPLMNYVKNRKLSSSINDLLWTDLRISDISQEYGFDYEQSYIRSFKNTFGISPDRFRKEKPALKIKDKINIDYIRQIGQDGITLEPPIFIIPEFYITGIRHKINLNDDRLLLEANRLGIEFYDLHMCKIENAINREVYIGLVEYDLDDPSHNHYITSVQTPAPEGIPVGMVCHKVPANKYASFKYIGLHPAKQISIRNLEATLKYIYTEWFPKSRYHQCASYHFERIDGRISSEDYCELEFFIPVVRET